MAVLPDYVTGTITLANGSTTVTGTGTMFATAAFRPGDTLQIQNLTAIIASVDSNTSLTLTEPWTGTSLTNAPYRARYLPDGARVTAQTTTLIELLGNGVLSNIAGIPVEDGNLLIGNTAGQYETISKDELGVQDPHGSLGKLAALTLAARQILQTDAEGDLKQVALAANKALVTDANGDVTPIDLGALGRALLALATGTNAQYVRGDGQLATLNKAAVGLGNVDNTSDAAKPISTATQTALNGKLSLTGGNVTGPIATISTVELRSVIPKIYMITPAAVYGYRMEANISDTVNGTWRVAAGYTGAALFQVGMDGSAIVSGTLTAGSKSFITDHPLDPLNADLVYASTESPSHGIEYWGTARLVNGRAVVDVDGRYGMRPGTFQAMTKDKVLFFQNQDSGKAVYRRWLDDGTFEIICDDETCNDLIGWQVKGERQDAVVFTLPNTDPQTGLLIPEQEKPDYVEVENA
ncbi:hypothetical protein [Brucella intermedia]|uniref:hypothetical protein n=1 Tax=Brucella intermedia TaxID=94625 RepID=UPI00224B7734|nr:hypothetical protein [Brucella intermedia]